MRKKKNIGLIITIVLSLLVIGGLVAILFKVWIIPSKQQDNLKNELKEVSAERVNEFVKLYNAEVEAKEEESFVSAPEIKNDLIDNTSWVNYNDNSIISFKDEYFVWYADESMSSDNYTLGKFEFYAGSDAFNLISDLFDESFEQTDADSVLIMKVMSKKVDGEEILESSEYKYLFGYYTEEIMDYIDLTSYNEYTFLKVDSDTESGANTESKSDTDAETSEIGVESETTGDAEAEDGTN